MPFALPGTTGKKARLAPPIKLDAVGEGTFYGNSSASSSRNKQPVQPLSPTGYAFQPSRNDKGKKPEVITVDDGDSGEESIEDASEIQETPALQSAQRPSMMNKRDKPRHKVDDGDAPVHVETPTATGSGAKAATKPRNAGGKGGVVSLLLSMVHMGFKD